MYEFLAPHRPGNSHYPSLHRSVIIVISDTHSLFTFTVAYNLPLVRSLIVLKVVTPMIRSVTLHLMNCCVCMLYSSTNKYVRRCNDIFPPKKAGNYNHRGPFIFLKRVFYIILQIRQKSTIKLSSVQQLLDYSGTPHSHIYKITCQT